MVSLLSGVAFCQPDRPQQCNTPWTVTSALVVTLGAVVWVSGPQAAASDAKASGTEALASGWSLPSALRMDDLFDPLDSWDSCMHRKCHA